MVAKTKHLVHLAEGTLNKWDKYPNFSRGQCGSHSVSSVSRLFDLITCPKCEGILYNFIQDNPDEYQEIRKLRGCDEPSIFG